MKNLKFLVIEDDSLLREVLCSALGEALREQEREAIIFEASDRGEATRIVEQHAHVDLILLDLELPDTDSFQFVRELEALLYRLGAVCFFRSISASPGIRRYRSWSCPSDKATIFLSTSVLRMILCWGG